MRIYIITLALISTACLHNSELKHETGIVVDKSFSPEFDGSGIGLGMSSEGNMVVTSNHIHKDEQFVLVFKCEHGSIFTIDRKELYKDLMPGDTVDIQYYERMNKSNEVKDFDFITATKKNQ